VPEPWTWRPPRVVDVVKEVLGEVKEWYSREEAILILKKYLEKLLEEVETPDDYP